MFFLLIILFVATAHGEFVYGLGPAVVQLMKIDTDTLKMTNIGKQLPELEAGQLASLDVKNQIFYLISYNVSSKHCYLSGLSLKDAEVKYHIQLPFLESAFVGVGQSIEVDPESGDVFVVGQLSDKLHHIYRVTPSTQKMTQIAKLGDINVLGGSSGYNPVSKILYLQYGVSSEIDIFGWNVETGKMMVHVKNTANLETMEYDPATRKIWGIGLKTVGNDVKRTLLTFDMKNTFEEIAEIDGYFILYVPLATLDVKNRHYFAFMQPSGAKSTDPMRMLTIDMKDGKVLEDPECYMSPKLGTPACPWSIEHPNKYQEM